jgi:hypothetical protein
MTRSWRMFAGRLANPVSGREFMNFGSERTVRFCGCTPVPVELTEDPDGTYWGWIRAASDGILPRKYTGVPEMIQPHEGMFSMQFPYGPQAEAERGRGEVVRMSCREIHSHSTS